MSCSMHSDAMSEISSRVNTRPVGLCGVLRTNARVRGVNAARSRSGLRVQAGGRAARTRAAPGQDAIRPVILVERLGDDHLVAGIDQGEEGRRHGFGAAAGDRHLALGVDLHVVHPPVLLGDREPEDRAAPGDRVLVDVPPNGGAGRFLHRLGHREVREALREVDGAVGLGDPRHLADDGFRERGRLGATDACGVSLLRGRSAIFR